MRKGFVFYKTLTETLVNKIGFQTSNYIFSYENQGENVVLATSRDETDGGNSSTIFLYDELSRWTPDNYNLIVKRDYIIQIPQFLFGEKGVASKESNLGIALSWTSKSSSQRGIIPIGSFNGDISLSKEIYLRTTFKKNNLRGEVNLETILYLKEHRGRSSNGFSEIPGTILGVLDSCTIIIDGSGSSFPIVEVSEPGEPLWWVEINWTDPLTDSFNEEYVSINLNTANKFFKTLNLDKGLSNSPVMIEIISSAIQIIIENLKSSGDWESIESGENLEDGSVAQAIYYFLTTFEWDFSSSQNLAKSIRKDLENRL